MPAATTLTVGKAFIVNCVGTQTVGIRDNAGTLLRTVQINGSASVLCSDNTTAAGQWVVTGTNLGNVLTLNERTQVSATPTTTVQSAEGDAVIQLSTTLVVYISYAGTTLYLTAHDLTTNTIGTTVSVASFTDSTFTVGKAVSATGGVVANWNGATVKAVAFTVAGTAIDIGTASTITAGTADRSAGANRPDNIITQLSGGTYLIAGGYSGAGPFQPQAIAFTVTGKVIAVGGLTNIGTTIATTIPALSTVLVRSATQAVIVLSDPAGTALSCRHVTIAGTGVTFNATGAVSHTLTSIFTTNPVSMNTDEWWIAVSSSVSTTVNICRITVSGTTPTITTSALGTVLTGNSASPLYRNPFLNRVSGTVASLFLPSASAGGFRLWTITWAGSFSDVSTTTLTVPIANQPYLSVPITPLGTKTNTPIALRAEASATSSVVPSLYLIDHATGIPTGNAVEFNASKQVSMAYFGNKIYVYSSISDPSTKSLSVYDATSYGLVSNQPIKMLAQSSVTQPSLVGNKVIHLSAATANTPFTGIYTQVMELC